MASSASWALQKGIYEALTSDVDVTSLLGGARVYDDVPQNASFPYLTFGQSQARDWSTGTEDGQEHVITLHVWSQAGGRHETQEIIGAVRKVLHDADLQLTDHSLINLRHEFSDARRDPDGEHFHGIIRYRAVMEPAS